MAPPSDIYSVFPKEQVLTPESGDAYAASILRWSDSASKRAKLVVLPETAADVSKAIQFAVANGLDMAIKGGGHSCSGSSSSEEFVIDLGRLKDVVVDKPRERCYVGGGAVWRDVDVELGKYGLAAVGGTVNHTGVGGLTVGGGYGYLTGKHGLAIDNLLEVELVLANGEIRICNEVQNEDLFWGVRGGGSNFGIVTKFTFKVHPQENPVWAGLLIFPGLKLNEFFDALVKWAARSGPDEGCHVFMGHPPPHHLPCLGLGPFYNGSAEEGKKKFQMFYDIGPLVDTTAEMPYCELNGVLNELASYGDRKAMKGTAFTNFTPERMGLLFNEYVKFVETNPDAGKSVIILEMHGFNKLVTVPNTATAFSNRGQWYNLTLAPRWTDPKLDYNCRTWARRQAEWLREQEKKIDHLDLVGVHGYANIALGDESVREAFGENYDRLVELKTKYDPQNVFNKWYPIPVKASI